VVLLLRGSIDENSNPMIACMRRITPEQECSGYSFEPDPHRLGWAFEASITLSVNRLSLLKHHTTEGILQRLIHCGLRRLPCLLVWETTSDTRKNRRWQIHRSILSLIS